MVPYFEKLLPKLVVYVVVSKAWTFCFKTVDLKAEKIMVIDKVLNKIQKRPENLIFLEKIKKCDL